MNNIIERIRLPFRRDRELFSSLYNILGFYPKRIEYYKMALLHRSMAAKNDKGRPVNNERLEFLGDAILDAVVGDIVFKYFPKKHEGFLTNVRSKIVSRKSLGVLAHTMGIERLIKNANHSMSHNNYMAGNAFEALIGAIYLDKGYECCLKFMKERILNEKFNLDKVANNDDNFKSQLLEWTQKNKVEINFVLLRESKEDNCSPYFKYQVELNGINGGVGCGYSKKESQQKASQETLKMLKRNIDFVNSIFAVDMLK